MIYKYIDHLWNFINYYIKEKKIKTIKSKEMIIAKVTIMGAKSGCGWRYTKYEADKTLKSGYRFVTPITAGMYPNKHNFALSAQMEKEWKPNYIIVIGRPIAGINAPVIA